MFKKLRTFAALAVASIAGAMGGSGSQQATEAKSPPRPPARARVRRGRRHYRERHRLQMVEAVGAIQYGINEGLEKQEAFLVTARHMCLPVRRRRQLWAKVQGMKRQGAMARAVA